ncbi:hypothetical protein BS50DRAFT_564194 [Corynespora cassiicola Philippines]|uniref:Uncharacterized protein n=1 Tax=Corynespora cassiicola Philippines TaxID=1448308 RepID=A0A2T2N4W7_CORCC|nr:hypothetical protein BS50DRAFT_564194 [Corynespora cassiicola Philippines]
MRLDINHITKGEFLEAYYTAYAAAITFQNNHNRFQATGVVPNDSERVFQRLDLLIKMSSPLFTEGSEWESKISRTLTEIKNQASNIHGQRRLRTKASRLPKDCTFGQLLKEFEKVVCERAIFEVEATESRIDNATAVLRGLLYMLVDQQP